MVFLTLANGLWPSAPSPLSTSSFGRSGSGHGALFELLGELGLNEGRSLESSRRLSGDATLWWIDPLGVCDGRIALQGEVDVLDAADVAWPGGAWVRAGGTAVVFLQAAEPGGRLSPAQERLARCDAIGGIELPRRSRQLRAASGPDVDSGEPASAGLLVSGELTRAPRSLSAERAYAFDESLDWQVAAEIQWSDGTLRPFVLSRVAGDGRLVVVADSGFTHNRWLDAADSAPLALDLVLAYGAPRFDEREHGMLPETSALRYLAGSQALPAILGLALLGVLFAWWGTALPARSVQEFDPAAPTLEAFVSSMAALYAGSRDHARVLERYRELSAERLRRHFGLPQGLSRLALADRIQRDGRLGASRLLPLTDTGAVDTAAELATAARQLDELVSEVIR
jgi:hypothetical protein